MLSIEEIARKENELQARYNTATEEIRRMKSRFSRARGISPLERLTIAVSICDMEEILVDTGKKMRILWFMKQAHMINARHSRTNPDGATHTDFQTEGTEESG